MFREYYIQDYPLSTSLLMIDRREFGFALFEGWMLRHRSFKIVILNSSPLVMMYS